MDASRAALPIALLASLKEKALRKKHRDGGDFEAKIENILPV
jgi:hypothetical protein